METTEKKYFVEVIEDATKSVIHRFECDNKHKAQKAEDGMQHNLNHDKFSTRVVEE